MKNTFIILFYLSVTGLFAQEMENLSSDLKHTNQSENEVQYKTSVVLEAQTYTLAYSLEEYEAMIIRCKELAEKLIEHDKIAQNGSMTKVQIKNWKRDLLEAKLLNYRLDDYTSMYQRQNYPLLEYVNIDVLNDYYDFSKILTSATQYASF